MPRKIAIACDHAGPDLKERIKDELEVLGFEVLDFGTDDTNAVDYPDYAEKVSQAIITGQADMGVLICGSGIGMSIAANRHQEIRAALCHNEVAAELSRRHNNANVLAVGARTINEETAIACVRKFFNTEFEGGRHEDRIAKFS